VIADYIRLKNVREIIEAYKSYGGKTWIRNPRLTITMSSELLEIVGHCIGDGFVTLKKGATSKYTNTSKKLIRDFKSLCSKVFGEVDLTTCYDKRFDAEDVSLPKVCSTILVHFFPEVLSKTIPKTVFQLSKKEISSFIRAFADDESGVTTSAIYYTQKDRAVLEDMRKLHLLVGFKETNLTPVKERRGIHNFSIKGDGLIYFHEHVGFKHPDKKKDLEIEIQRKKNKRRIKTVDETKKEITRFLSTPKTTKELSVIIGVQPSRIRKHMKRLEKEGYVKTISYTKYKVPLWVKIREYKLIDERRKEKIIDFLKESQLSTLEISKKIGLGKDRLMTYLYELTKEGKINYKVKGRTYIWSLE